MVYKFLIKKSSGSGVNNRIKQNQQLAEELQKPIIKNLLKRRVYSSFKDNVWAGDLADMQFIGKFNKGNRFLLRAIDIFSKYALIVLLKDKNGIIIVNGFEKLLDKSTRKSNKIWVDKSSEFCNSSFKKWLKDNDIEIYSTHNEVKSVVAEIFMRTLKNKIDKHMTVASKDI